MAADKSAAIDTDTQSYDGCLGQLQANQSDTQLPMLEYPVMGHSMRHGFPTKTHRTLIVSAYNSSGIPINTNVLDAFASLDVAVWLTIAVMLLLIAGMLIVMHKMYVKPDQKVASADIGKILIPNSESKPSCTTYTCSKAIIIGAMSKQHTSYSVAHDTHANRLLLVVLAIFTFLIIFYFSSMIKTDMVVVKPPDTISSFADIIARPHVKPLWMSSMRNHLEFEHAPAGAPQAKIWDRTRTMGGAHNCCLISAREEIMQTAPTTARLESVWLVTSQLRQVMIALVCTAVPMLDLSSMRAWINEDDNSREYLSGQMVSAHSPSSVQQLLDFSFKSVLEHRLLQMVTPLMALQPDPSRSPSVKDEYRICMRNKLVVAEADVRSPTLSHYTSLIALTAAALIAAAVALLIEKIGSRWARVTRRRVRV